jgi:PAS domain S-box-containing protein
MANPEKPSREQLFKEIESLNASSAINAQHLAEELRTHQIELEMQNRELRETQQKLELARDRYADLYDFAPVGYATLDRKGHIQEINLTGAALLGRERSFLVGKNFLNWVTRESLTVFFHHLEKVFTSSAKTIDEITLKTKGGGLRHISIASVAIDEAEKPCSCCRTVLLDITEAKEQERNLRKSQKLLRDLSAHHNQVREEERKRIAREIHDELGQKLTALQLETSMLAINFGDTHPQLSEKTQSILKLIDSTMEGVRAIASDLRPAVLDLGLTAAIEWQLEDFHKRTGISCELVDGHNIEVSSTCATAIFRILQEALTNIARHAQANKVKVTLKKARGFIAMKVEDDGIGITAADLKRAKKFGIAGIRERALMLGGKFKIQGKPGVGTVLSISIAIDLENNQT